MSTPNEPASSEHPLVVGVRLRPAGQVYDFDPGPLILHRDDRVLVETERGPTLGTVVLPPTRRPTNRHLQRVVKKADARDLAREDKNLQQERELRATALDTLRARRFPAKLVKVETAFDGSRVTVFIAADDRLELRDLVRDLGQAFGTRVEVKQIGARDEAKVAGGVGVCGRELCCSSWLREFQAVSVKMVKAQGLSLNPAKLAGQCGRLKCCLRYEYETYVELKRGLPAIGATVESVKGNGKVVAQSILKQTVAIQLEGDGGRVEATLEDLVARRHDA
ncbi:MAG TPA: regulatory iron-sulfur-containing complex subunit RicT [Candidatus Eisenbacteria bacterium]|nr:regulatory iron-sulfur-containing complex subunit RicT [Candidatus Eisenbacteria bacterium]